jgi:septum formation protein
MSQSPAAARRLVLASTSAYRRELLGRLGLPFECARPETDETPLPGEPPAQTALRLAAAKANAVRALFPDALVIGSDQVASCEGHRLDKPGTHEKAVAQLTFLSGRSASFDTAVCLLDTQSGRAETRTIPCRVHFRPLTPETIEAYLRQEQPYDCAGSAKAEGLGIALIERIETEDPTSLIGLPLIALTGLLASFGLSPV